MFSFFRRKTDFFLAPEESQKKIEEKYKKHLSKFTADKEREEKRKKKEEEMKKENLKRLTPTVKEISAEEAEKLKKQEEEQKASVNVVKPTVPKKEEEKKDEEEGKGAKPNLGNGGSADKYVWSQKLEDLQINIPVDPKYSGKDIIIKYKSKTLSVAIKNGETIIDGEFPHPIKPDTFVWFLDSSSLTDMKMIIITFEKYDSQKWWDCAIKGDPVINTQKINPEPSKLSDLDGDTRRQVDKMMFDQRQKEMGLPVSDDMDKYEKMQKFMKSHPEMDFSKAKFS